MCICHQVCLVLIDIHLLGLVQVSRKSQDRIVNLQMFPLLVFMQFLLTWIECLTRKDMEGILDGYTGRVSG